MIRFIDTHAHLYLQEFDNDRDEVVKRALDNNVVKLFMPNIDINSVDDMISCEERYPGICYPMIGLHPTSVRQDYLSQLDTIEEKASQHSFIAIGEIGIDLYWDKTFIEEQKTALKRQIMLSLKYNLPVVIHSRESFPVVFDLLEEFRGSDIRGVFHAFSGDISIAEKAIMIGFKIGIGGIVTFKNSGLETVVKGIGLEHIVIETDSPYLAPAPNRGKRNESAYVSLISKKISEITGADYETVALKTYSNSIELFRMAENEK
jgi:TatD DNase family protein